jgi:hypothetical protein
MKQTIVAAVFVKATLVLIAGHVVIIILFMMNNEEAVGWAERFYPSRER